MSAVTPSVSSSFIWRRIHSLLGLWIVIYLIEHLLVNSQASLWLGDDGVGFIKMVNLIQSLPYLQVIETLLIGIPIAVHAVWGIKRALSAKRNAHKTDGSRPDLSQYERNRSFSLQRLSSWILLVGIIGHVIQMRFLEKPKEVEVGGVKEYFMKVSFDEGLYTLSARLNTVLYSPQKIAETSEKEPASEEIPPLDKKETQFNLESEETFQDVQREEENKNKIKTLSSYNLKEGDVIVGAPSPGTAILFMVRDTFKNPIYSVLYTLFVLAAAFHAFHGVWTFLITWGVILSYRSQRFMIPFSILGMLVLAFFGLAAIWGSYFINLKS